MTAGSWPERYKSPPIVEAIVELTWTTPLRPDQVELVKTRLSGDYPVAETRAAIDLQLHVGAGAIGSAASHRIDRWILRSASDPSQAVSVAASTLSVHALRPYPGWAVLSERARRCVNLLAAESNKLPLFSTVMLRYLDLIVLRGDEGENVRDYFTGLMASSTSMGSGLVGLQQTLQTRDPTTGQLATLTIATGAPADGKPTMLLDLQLKRDIGKDTSAWITLLESMHVQQRQIFEESITPHTRRLFE